MSTFEARKFILNFTFTNADNMLLTITHSRWNFSNNNNNFPIIIRGLFQEHNIVYVCLGKRNLWMQPCFTSSYLRVHLHDVQGPFPNVGNLWARSWIGLSSLRTKEYGEYYTLWHKVGMVCITVNIGYGFIIPPALVSGTAITTSSIGVSEYNNNRKGFKKPQIHICLCPYAYPRPYGKTDPMAKVFFYSPAPHLCTKPCYIYRACEDCSLLCKVILYSLLFSKS